MKNVKVVIGANFGDEGKGLMTDYFCSQAPPNEKVLNVRFNGGAQAGHTVVAPDGRRHIFSHFGAGSFLSNVATYLGPEYIINPILFRREYERLEKLGVIPMIYCHPRCLITFPQDMMVNQFIEKRRGTDRHGSCGIGIFETLLRSRKDSDISASTLTVLGMKHCQIDIDYYSNERVEKIFGVTLEQDEKALLINQNIRAHFNQDIKFFMDHVSFVDEKIFRHFNHVVFEGAQGLLLDQNNSAYFPHLTPSNTGIQNVVPYLDRSMDVEVCYVTRPYLTRHGAGKLPNECPREMTGAKPDLTNHINEWQGELRYGKLNVADLMKRCEDDIEPIYYFSKISYAVTHMDEALKSDLMPYSDDLYLSYGPCRTNVKKLFGEDDDINRSD
jgi:adenylosuccinate synthase